MDMTEQETNKDIEGSLNSKRKGSVDEDVW